MFGLRKTDLQQIILILRSFPAVEQALIFGSRAKGNYKNGSDVDISIRGPEVNYDMALKIGGILNEDTSMPYHFDVLSYRDITNQQLKDHIDRVGKLIYQEQVGVNDPPSEYPQNRGKKASK